MSDYYRNDPHQNGFDESDASGDSRNVWQQPDPFAPYDDPQAAAMADAPQEEDFSAWRRPAGMPSAPPSFLQDEPAPYGAEMQQGGVPFPQAAIPMDVENSFLTQGDDAPTRIGKPIVPAQMVSKRKTVDRGEKPVFTPPVVPVSAPYNTEENQPAPVQPARRSMPAQEGPGEPAAQEGEPRRQRRAGRMARYHEGTPDAAAAVPDAAPARMPVEPPVEPYSPVEEPRAQQISRPAFDPFEAGDSEAVPENPRPARRPAVPGERYTGARTAMPQSGAPIPRNQVGALDEEGHSLADKARQTRDRVMAQNGFDREDDGIPYQEAERPARPPQGQRPQGQPPQNGQRPVRPQQGQRPPQLDEEGRPIRPQGQRPQGQPPQNGQRPMRPQQGQRPQQLDENGRPIRPPQQRPRPQGMEGERRPVQGEQDMYRERDARGAAPARKQRPAARKASDFDDSDRYVPSGRGADDGGRYSPHASVNRPRYDFEDEEDEIEVRRRGCLVPILIVLLVLGLLLAGILLPSWDSTSGGIGGALGGVKSTITGLFDSVKNMIFPTETAITSFTVTPTEATAPAELIFNVQTSTSVTDLRIIDENGGVVVQKTLTDADSLNGNVIKNQNDLIWTIQYTAQDAYAGLYTVQSLQKDGTWDEGVALASTVAIAAPVVAAPPVQNFSSDTSEAEVPATLSFVAQTSDDVVAVRIVDDYGVTIASRNLHDSNDDTGNVLQTSDSVIWELKAQVDEAYEGSYTLQYQEADDVNFTPSDYDTFVELHAAAAPLTSGGDEGDDVDALAANGEEGGEGGDGALAAAANASVDGLSGDEDGDGADGGEIPDEEPAAAATPEPAATPAPLPALAASSTEETAPSAIKLSETIYEELKTAKTYTREKSISMLDPYNYAIWQQSGVLTFRGGPLRKNAAYGTVDVSSNSLSEIWRVPVGSKKLSKSTVHGIVWPGQPAIVKWPTEVRNMMSTLNDEKKDTTALKEVILGGQDGLIYFLDLTDGAATREPIDMGAPSAGGVSIATNGMPILGIGQSHSNLSGKQVDNGYHLFDLITGKELLLLNGRDKSANSSYSGFSGAALFDKQSESMIVGGQNGVLYTVEISADEDWHKTGKLNFQAATQRYKTLASKQEKKNTNIEASVAMYNNYVYYGDITGVLQCMDINTLTPVWAVKTDDSIYATPALDFEGEDTLALYTGNTILKQGKKGVCTIRRLDGLTGKEVWSYEVPELTYTTSNQIGCVASPVVGENAISDLVIFTITNGEGGSQVTAFKKSSGSIAWTTSLETESLSSPVAVYNDNGDAWLIQGESNGKLHLMNAKTGEIVNTMQLEGQIEGSPAVYRNILVIGTTSADNSYIYGIQIQ